MEATMLPSQKRKALAPPDSPPRTKSSRAVAAAPGLPAEPSASSRDVGSVRAVPLGSPDGPPGLRADRDVKDEGSREWQNADEACPRPPDHRTEGSAGETAVGLPGVNRDPWLAGVPFSSSQSPEADPVVTGAPTAQSPPGPSQPPAHAATATPPSRSDRGGLWPREVCTGTPSDEEKDEGERNLVITVGTYSIGVPKAAPFIYKAPSRSQEAGGGWLSGNVSAS
ncbi:collagen alpha-1(XXVI) chain-like [Chiloscyllium plagiosum]|uniref:collagen alpha-1(XXVI) chain-like n=1 Tax=Chiloscyllium plagiosum TaxID=36176 RepID=UPI001CB809AA|nr:collagen alpha-1(XXVI) chain-like [Chiloscyllium plagiosum]